MADSAGFNRILTLLRKERGITQKDAASSLGISQALLSHYEKGIRECGLDFVVRAAEYYNVSCDYLLGRSPDRSGITISVDDLPDDDSKDDTKFKGSVLPVLNKRLLTNSISVLFDLLVKTPSKTLTNEVSNYMMTAFYKIFRIVYAANPKNQNDMFSVPKQLYDGYADASMKRSEARISAMLSGDRIPDIESVENVDLLLLTTEKISETYPQNASALFNLIQQTEKNLSK